MTDPNPSDNESYTAENADATQPPERLKDVMDEGGVCLHCGEQCPTLDELQDHVGECDHKDESVF
jgi:hypothetical protein